MKNKIINYNFFYWGPFLYKTTMIKKEVDAIKKLCNKNSKDMRKSLAGIIRHEHKINNLKLFKIINPYFQSYFKALGQHYNKYLGKKIKLKTSWVNYMIKGESNPIHTHDGDLSFVLFLEIPKNLKKEYNNHIGNTKPGTINFIYDLSNKKELINEHSFLPEVGELFIFPACLSHYVNVFNSKGERISISGNLEITNG